MHLAGFDTLPSTESSSPASSSDRPSSPPPRALGALPKRRSPRNLSKNLSTKVTGVERLPRGGKIDKKPGSFVNFTSSSTSFPPSQKRALFKYEPRQHMDGRDACDMVSKSIVQIKFKSLDYEPFFGHAQLFIQPRYECCLK